MMTAPFHSRTLDAPADEPEGTILIGGLPVSRLSRRGLITRMLADCFAARWGAAAPKLIFSANGNALSRAASDPDFRRLMDQADIIHADGQPLVFASRLVDRTGIAERSATTDLIHDAAAAAAAHGLRFFLLGSSEAINARAAGVLEAAYPGLIAGRRNGYFAAGEEAAVCAAINASGADIVWVGMGLGREDAFCVNNRAGLKAGWLVTCGGCLNFVAGDYRRAPRWMQNVGLEWAYRLWREPRRLLRRYAVTNIHALWLMATRSGLHRA